jgi:hypothetical protein
MIIKTLEKIDTAVVALVEPSGGFIIFPLGKDAYTIVSDAIVKSSITQYKLDALECNFNLLKLKKKWM